MKLKPGDKVLIAGPVPTTDPMAGTVKIGGWSRRLVENEFHWASGISLPGDLSQCHLIVHYGAALIARGRPGETGPSPKGSRGTMAC